MANLDLEEQEQLDELKHFWRQYGNLITWTLVLVLAAYAAWNGWQLWQRRQAAEASGVYAELQRAAELGEAAKVNKLFGQLRDDYGRTTFAEQGGLLAARVQFEKGQGDAARTTLAWVAEHASEAEYRAMARLRLAALLLDDKKFDEALKQVTGDFPVTFAPLAADRRGDILQAQGKSAEAVKAYQDSYAAMSTRVEYRRLVEAKLTALGAPPAVADAASAPAGAASGGQS